MNKDNTFDIVNEDLASRIYEEVSELKSLEKPNTIDSGMDADDKLIANTYKKIDKLLLDQKINLIMNLGRNHKELGELHKFVEMSEKSRNSAIRRLREKIAFDESQRKSQLVLNNTQICKNDVISNNEEENNSDDHEEKPKKILKNKKNTKTTHDD